MFPTSGATELRKYGFATFLTGNAPQPSWGVRCDDNDFIFGGARPVGARDDKDLIFGGARPSNLKNAFLWP